MMSMDTKKQIKKFTKFICKKYESSDAFKINGELLEILIKESKVSFDNAETQLALMDFLMQQGLIEPVNSKDIEHITSDTIIRPTIECLNPERQGWTYRTGSNKEKSIKKIRDIDRFIDTITRWARF